MSQYYNDKELNEILVDEGFKGDVNNPELIEVVEVIYEDEMEVTGL